MILRAGKILGGKIATPVREMISSREFNGVIFRCASPKHAETTRTAALTLKLRNDYDIKTSRKGSDLIVYKDNGIDYPHMFSVNNCLEKGEAND